MKKILLLGPFPVGDKGLNGQTIANQTLYEGLSKIYKVNRINTLKNLEFTDKAEQGKFKIGKFVKIVSTLINENFNILFTKYDVIYMTPGQSFWGFMRFTPYMLSSFMKNAPCYIHIHGGNFRKMYDKESSLKKILMNFFIRRITGIIVLGNSLKSMFNGLVEDSKVFVCENGVQDEIVATQEKIKKKMKRIGSSSKRKILYLSNLMKEKGILELLRASEELSEKEFEFNLVGAIEPNIKNIVDEYLKRYPNKIYYHGIVSGQDKKKIFLENDIFILPSWDEGQPISILEAYAKGCYVITDSNIGGIKDIFIDKINGKKIIAKNTESIKEGLRNLEKVDEINLYNYIFFKTNYTKNKFLERIIRVIIR